MIRRLVSSQTGGQIEWAEGAAADERRDANMLGGQRFIHNHLFEVLSLQHLSQQEFPDFLIYLIISSKLCAPIDSGSLGVPARPCQICANLCTRSSVRALHHFNESLNHDLANLASLLKL